MEVLFITHSYPPSIGGMQKQSYELINGASKKTKVHSLIYDNKEGKFFFFLYLRYRVKKILQENPDISLIHLNDGLMAVIAAHTALKKLTKKPIIITIHGLEVVHPSSLVQKYFVKLYQKFDATITVSSAIRQECIQRGASPDKVFVVKNGVDQHIAEIKKDEEFKSKLENQLGISLENKKLLVTIGRPVLRKGMSWFLKNVFPELEKDVVYIIIGPRQKNLKLKMFLYKIFPKRVSYHLALLFGFGIDEVNVHKELEKSDNINRAFYLGRTSHQDIYQILKLAHLFIMPNRKIKGDAEGFGLVALEAAISGTPVVASAVDGITDAVIDGKNGFLLESENKEMWVQTLKEMLLDTNKINEFGQQAKTFTLQTFSWEKMAQGYLKIFQKYHLSEKETVHKETNKKIEVNKSENYCYEQTY